MDLREKILERQPFESLQFGNILRGFGETEIEHPRHDVLDVASQRMTDARVDVVLRHATVERHVRAEREMSMITSINVTAFSKSLLNG